MDEPFEPCAAVGCHRNASRIANGRKGLCPTHYQRMKRHGDFDTVKRPPSPAIDWLTRHVSHVGDECLIWPFATGADGYGRVHRPGSGALTTTSNLMCEMAHGPAPSPKHQAAHSCGLGHTGCVHPQHLRWDTPAGNHADKVTHGSSVRGERQHASRLTEDQVRQIRSEAATASHRALAVRFGVAKTTISRILSRKMWSWVD